MREPTVSTFEPRYGADFARLNYAWIERLFGIEEPDREVLDHPQEAVIAAGGQIFFVLVDAKVVATVALKPIDRHTFELCKMAVDDAYQGRGYARLLLTAALDWAREHRARQVELYSHSSLAAALALYRSAGFVEVASACGASTRCGGYERCDIHMRKPL